MIYVVAHKQFDDSFIEKKHYAILTVGGEKFGDESYLRDSSGDNIADKNPNYCELTALYWIWKNSGESDDEITGLLHYRRYLTTRFADFKYAYCGKMPSVLEYASIEKTLKKYDIILPRRMKMIRNTVWNSYSERHVREDMELTRQTIEDVCPEYTAAFDCVMKKHELFYANVLICKKKILNKYAQWLFTVLFELEKKIDLNKYEDPYQARVFGFLAERLLNVWVVHKKLRVKEFPLFNTEVKSDNLFDRTGKRLRNLFLMAGKRRDKTLGKNNNAK